MYVFGRSFSHFVCRRKQPADKRLGATAMTNTARR
jgi:hypothetical protein